MAYPKEHQAKLDYLEKIAHHASALLKKSPSPHHEMSWAEDHLWRAGLWLGNDPEVKDRASWTAQVIAQNPELLDRSLPYLEDKGLHPEQAESFEGLISLLIPREGGL